jgi:hypothetical protein
MHAPSSPLRVAGNLLVIILLLVGVAYVFDLVFAWFGARPFFACNVLPAWLALSDPWPLLIALGGLGLWAFTRSREAMLIVVIGLMVGVVPWVINDALPGMCTGTLASPAIAPA